MIDFHTHILPKLDDGSRDMTETRQMLKMEYEQGVKKIVATSHFYAEREFPERFLEKRSKRLDEVREMLSETPWGMQQKIYAGAEVFYYMGMADSPMLPQLCIEGTETLLLEMPFVQWSGEMYREVHRIVENRKLQVVLAHVERYYRLQKDKTIWNEILQLPLAVQLNADEITAFRTKKICRNLLTSGIPILLGSDCHNMQKRVPNLPKGRKAVEKLVGKEKLDEIDKFGEQVLGL